MQKDTAAMAKFVEDESHPRGINAALPPKQDGTMATDRGSSVLLPELELICIAWAWHQSKAGRQPPAIAANLNEQFGNGTAIVTSAMVTDWLSRERARQAVAIPPPHHDREAA